MGWWTTVVVLVVGFALGQFGAFVAALDERRRARSRAVAVLLRTKKRLHAFVRSTEHLARKAPDDRVLELAKDTLGEESRWVRDEYRSVVDSIAANDPVLAFRLYHKDDPFSDLHDLAARTTPQTISYMLGEIGRMAAEREREIVAVICDLTPWWRLRQKNRIKDVIRREEVR